MEDFDYMIIIGIFYIINCLILFLTNITFCFIHIRETFFHTNFFKVIFAQIILESLISLFLLLLVLTILFSGENEEWHLFFHLVLNYCINTDLFYNIIILLYLNFNRNREGEETINSKNLRDSISFGRHTFKFIHIPSLCLGLVHSIIFIFIRDTDDYTIQSMGKWYYFFYPVEAKLSTIIFLFPFLLLFILSILYKFVSKNKLSITNNIHLTHYCINCLICGALCTVMPIIKVAGESVKNSEFIVLLFSSAIFLLYLNCLCLYRFNCFYLNDVLSNNGKDFKNKIKLFLNLMLFRVEVPKPNFLDYNSTFIYHSLAYESDFSSVDKRLLSGSISGQ